MTDEDNTPPNATDLPEAEPIQTSSATWGALGFNPSPTPSGSLQGIVPKGRFILAAKGKDEQEALSRFCMEITTSMPFHFEEGGQTYFGYALADSLVLPENPSLPVGTELLAAGAAVSLPREPPQVPFPIVTKEELAFFSAPELDPTIVDSPLSYYSLRGRGEEFEKRAARSTPLLANLCLTGQATALFGPPNSAKTAITMKLTADAVNDKRINPDNVYYINQDDNSEGLAIKMRILDDLGCHTIAPGYNGYRADGLNDLLHSMAANKKAKGALIIIDTIKKSANLMDKGSASAFTNACRAAVMAGSTVVGLAHTNKAPGANGKLVYGGTSDLRDDFDAAYILTPIELEGFDGEKVVQFENIKSRGANAQVATYAYASAPELSYVERLASVRLVDEQELRGFRRLEEAKADAEVVQAIAACIRSGDYAKMALAKAVATRAGISERAALRMIEKYTGNDPATAKWRFERRNRGAMIYALLPNATDEPPPAE